MAYSNTNKDKVQVKVRNWLKNAGIAVILLIITVSGWSNIGQQAIILHEAKKRNQNTEEKIEQLTEANKILEKQIKVATDSANRQRKIREYLGLGESGDVWLQTDLEMTENSLQEKMTVEVEEPIIQQWWNLFTK